ncbi:MAG: hypothetical protein FWC72_02505 [Oscillospiraceae bacterium]|nr:hypothetical protein [Oscillospiraceae bacterium]
MWNIVTVVGSLLIRLGLNEGLGFFVMVFCHFVLKHNFQLGMPAGGDTFFAFGRKKYPNEYVCQGGINDIFSRNSKKPAATPLNGDMAVFCCPKLLTIMQERNLAPCMVCLFGTPLGNQGLYGNVSLTC